MRAISLPAALVCLGLALVVPIARGTDAPAPLHHCERIAVPDAPGSRTATYYPYAVAVLKGTTTCPQARRLLAAFQTTAVSPKGWYCARWHGSDAIAATCASPAAAPDLPEATDVVRSYPDKLQACRQTAGAGARPGAQLRARRLQVTGGLGCRAAAQLVHRYLTLALTHESTCAGPAVNAPYRGCVVGAFRCRSFPVASTPARYCSDRRGRWVQWREQDLTSD